MTTSTAQTSAARHINHDHDDVTERATVLMDDPDLTFPVLMAAVTHTPALTTFAGNRPQALEYVRLTAGEVSLAYALASYGMTSQEIQRAASGQDRYCTARVPTGDGRKVPCWHLLSSGGCPNLRGHAGWVNQQTHG